MRNLPRSPDDARSFYKIFLPFFSTRLRLPTQVASLFGRKSPRQFVLETNAGKSWVVKSQRIDGHQFFTQGWSTFVNENQLEDADLLVFWLVGKSTFKVVILGANGCEKRFNLPPTGDHREEVSTTEMDKTNESTKEESLPYSTDTQDDAEEDSDESEEDIDMCGTSRQIRPRKGKTCKFMGNPRNCPIKVESETDEDNPTDDLNSPTRKWSFTTVLRKCNAYYLVVPAAVSKEFELETLTNLKLQDPRGQVWTVGLTFWKSSGSTAITKSWNELLVANKFTIGSKCLFEFVQSSGDLFAYLFEVQKGREPFRSTMRRGRPPKRNLPFVKTQNTAFV